MTGKHGKMEPKRTCSTLNLSRQRAGTGLEAPGRSRLSRRGVQPISVGGCWHADARDLGDSIFFLRTIAGGRLDKLTQLATFREIMTLPMGGQQIREVKLDNEQHKQFNPGG